MASSQAAPFDASASSDTERVLRRITDLDHWSMADPVPGPTRILAFLDTETDGLDPKEDRIIEIAVALVRVDAAGHIVEIVSKGSGRENPGRPLPPKITALTGLTDADLAGTRIAVDRLTNFICQASGIVVHNAVFDRPFVERLLPGVAHLPWICTCRDVGWMAHGYDGAKLGHLLMQQSMWAPRAHRAMDDVAALVNLAETTLPNGRTVMAEALQTAQQPTVRIDAADSMFSEKGELKRRGYRFDWSHRRVWWSEVPQAEADAEEAWLRATLKQVRPTRTPITWHERYR